MKREERSKPMPVWFLGELLSLSLSTVQCYPTPVLFSLSPSGISWHVFSWIIFHTTSTDIAQCFCLPITLFFFSFFVNPQGINPLIRSEPSGSNHFPKVYQGATKYLMYKAFRDVSHSTHKMYVYLYLAFTIFYLHVCLSSILWSPLGPLSSCLTHFRQF
jgi:hypothetical protein